MTGEIMAIKAGLAIADQGVDIGGKVVKIVDEAVDHAHNRKIERNETNVKLAAEVIQEADTALGVMLKAADVSNYINRIKRMYGPYGFVHRQDFIQVNGKNAKIVWDYILWNELTIEIFVPGDVSIKYSIAEKTSDKETERLYNKILNSPDIIVL